MPVRRMTEAEAQQIFGSGLIIIGMKRPMRSGFYQTGDKHHGQVSRLPGVEAEREDIRGQGILSSIPSPDR